MQKDILVVIFNAFLLMGISLQNAYSDDVFKYDDTSLTKARPWTSQKFQNNPNEFQFVIIGDRTGAPTCWEPLSSP
jgi:hypothetical protein